MHLPGQNIRPDSLISKIKEEQVLPKLREPVLVTVDEVVGTGVAVAGGVEAARTSSVSMGRLTQQQCAPGTGGIVAPEGLGALTPKAALLQGNVCSSPFRDSNLR